MYWLKVYKVPEAGRTARGRALVNLLNLKEEEEQISAILPIREFAEDSFVVMATDTGIVKKTELSAFSKPRKGGIIACSLKEGESLIGVKIAKAEDNVLLSSASGKAIAFAAENVRTMGRSARGVKGISLGADDKTVGMRVIPLEQIEDLALLTVCENGYGKRTKLTEYRTQNRGGKGLIDIQTADRNGPVVGVAIVRDKDEVMLMTSSSKVIRMKVSDISIVGRNTKGVRLVNLNDGEKVAATAYLAETEEPEVAPAAESNDKE